MPDGLDLGDFAARLGGHGWQVVRADEPRSLPVVVAERYPKLSADHAALIRGLVTCASPTGRCRLVVGEAFEARPPAFRWNEPELMSLEAAQDDAEWRASIVRFWNGHVPLAMDATSDHDTWLLRRSDGAVLHAFGPDWEEEPAVVSRRLRPFLAELARVGEPPRDAVPHSTEAEGA